MHLLLITAGAVAFTRLFSAVFLCPNLIAEVKCNRFVYSFNKKGVMILKFEFVEWNIDFGVKIKSYENYWYNLLEDNDD